MPRLTDGVETGWHMFPMLVNPDSGIRRSELQQFMEAHGIDTRMVWTGNAVRQPAFKGVPHRTPTGGLPNADAVMETGLILPSNHGICDDGISYICEMLDEFLTKQRLR